ncbi:MAG: ABC transporter ATP-binding protein/permease [Bacteroidales bacterium]|nr:ABC transporter ATP-binding protein/permease [Lachnoclostridium sp.]MCM1384350.1 ABC transporter ATP-binding protein/permease [Lachnoclostridium sp.]MCM1464931.1 ABC transporter ATP-binding protein/permease [Bacteroidales bacterium]
MKLWKLFVRTMKLMGKRCILYLAGIFFMSACWAMFSVLSSLLMKNVMDAAQSGDSRRMAYVILGNVIGGILSLIVYRWASIVYNVEAKRAYGTVCKLLFHHEVRLPYEYYETHHSGDFMSKLSYDLQKMGSIYGSRLRRTVAPLIQMLVFLVPMLCLNWQITLCLAGANLVLLCINSLMIEPMRRVTKKLSIINGKMTEKLSNLLQGMEQVRMYAAGKETVQEFVRENAVYAKQSRKKILYTAFLEGCNGGFGLLCSLVFLMLGIYFVQKGYATLGALTAIYFLYGSFSFQFLQLGRYLPELIGCLTNAQNIFDFLAEEEEPKNWYQEDAAGENEAAEVLENAVKEGRKQERQKAEKGKAEKTPETDFLEISNIKFCYREDKPLLDAYSMRMKKGESIAVTGSSGCGKTTLSKLLLGLYPFAEGDIYLDGKSYRQMENGEIRSLIAYVPQEPYLFNVSVKENILIGRPDASEEEIIQAAKLAHAHEFIMNLENGYDTNAGERGNRLSGGQRQRIAIARAILKDAPIVLLDEATSALDNESEQLVNDALKSMKNGKNIIMIAHRPSTIALADRVCEFQ